MTEKCAQRLTVCLGEMADRILNRFDDAEVVGWVANPPNLLSSFWIVKPPPAVAPRNDDSLIPDHLIPDP